MQCDFAGELLFHLLCSFFVLPKVNKILDENVLWAAHLIILIQNRSIFKNYVFFCNIFYIDWTNESRSNTFFLLIFFSYFHQTQNTDCILYAILEIDFFFSQSIDLKIIRHVMFLFVWSFQPHRLWDQLKKKTIKLFDVRLVKRIDCSCFRVFFRYCSVCSLIPWTFTRFKHKRHTSVRLIFHVLFRWWRYCHWFANCSLVVYLLSSRE